MMVQKMEQSIFKLGIIFHIVSQLGFSFILCPEQSLSFLGISHFYFIWKNFCISAHPRRHCLILRCGNGRESKMSSNFQQV
jgi:hypothetical protein